MKTNGLRIVLSAILVVAVMLPAARTLAATDGERSKDDPVVGTWNCTLPESSTFGLSGQINVIKSFHADGTITEMDTAGPPSTQTPTLGTWTRTGNRTYSVKLQQFLFDSSGNFLGTARYVHPTLTMNQTGNTLSGTVDGTFLDATTGTEYPIFTGLGLSCRRY